MSTRCNIVVKCGGRFRCQIYHHHDGGFNFVGKELCEFLEKVCIDEGSLEDIADDCCYFLHYQDPEYEIEEDKMCEKLHGDIEYVYYIDFLSKDEDVVNIRLTGKCLYSGEKIDYTYHRKM